MRKLRVWMLACGLAGAVASAAEGQVVYNNGAPSSTLLDANPSLSQGVIYQSFTLSSSTDISDIQFWTNDRFTGATQPDYAGSFYWVIRSSVSAAPGLILFGGATVVPGAPVLDGTANNNPGPTNQTNDYRYDLAVNFSLGAGTYFLGLHNGALSHVASDNFYWTRTASGGDGLADFYSTNADGGPFYNGDPYNEAFNLIGTPSGTGTAAAVTPEPATMTLMATGLVAIAGAARRRKKQ